MTTIQHANDKANGCATWRQQCARLTHKLAAACTVAVVAEDAANSDRGETHGECVRLVRELADACAACVAAENDGDTAGGARLLDEGGRLFRKLAAMFVPRDAEAFSDDSLTRKRLERAFATCLASAGSNDTASSTTWCDQDTRLSLVQALAHATGLAAEALRDEPAENAAHVAWGDAHDAQNRLRAANLPEIETAYDESSAVLEAERRSALCSAALTRSHARRPTQARSRARRPRRSKPRRPSASSDGEGEGPPAAPRDHGAPSCQSPVSRLYRVAPVVLDDSRSAVFSAPRQGAIAPRATSPEWRRR